MTTDPKPRSKKKEKEKESILRWEPHYSSPSIAVPCLLAGLATSETSHLRAIKNHFHIPTSYETDLCVGRYLPTNKLESQVDSQYACIGYCTSTCDMHLYHIVSSLTGYRHILVVLRNASSLVGPCLTKPSLCAYQCCCLDLSFHERSPRYRDLRYQARSKTQYVPSTFFFSLFLSETFLSPQSRLPPFADGICDCKSTLSRIRVSKKKKKPCQHCMGSAAINPRRSSQFKTNSVNCIQRPGV